MKTNQFNLLTLFLLFSIIGNAQKYTRTNNSVITKSYNDIEFSSAKTFAENIDEASDFSMLNRALKNKDVIEAIEKEEMVTIFAISNKGFAIPQQEQDSIFSVSNKARLKAIIKYHIIPGRVDSHSLKKAVERSNGIAYFATLQGEKIGVKQENGQLYLVDSNGNTSLITATDFYHKNGFFHIVDGFVYPVK